MALPDISHFKPEDYLPTMGKSAYGPDYFLSWTDFLDFATANNRGRGVGGRAFGGLIRFARRQTNGEGRYLDYPPLVVKPTFEPGNHGLINHRLYTARTNEIYKLSEFLGRQLEHPGSDHAKWVIQDLGPKIATESVKFWHAISSHYLELESH